MKEMMYLKILCQSARLAPPPIAIILQRLHGGSDFLAYVDAIGEIDSLHSCHGAGNQCIRSTNRAPLAS
jgi:hypothetical protein